MSDLEDQLREQSVLLGWSLPRRAAEEIARLRALVKDAYNQGMHAGQQGARPPCCCEIADDEETIVLPCAAHAAWRDAAVAQAIGERDEARAKLAALRQVCAALLPAAMQTPERMASLDEPWRTAGKALMSTPRDEQ